MPPDAALLHSLMTPGTANAVPGVRLSRTTRAAPDGATNTATRGLTAIKERLMGTLTHPVPGAPSAGHAHR